MSDYPTQLTPRVLHSLLQGSVSIGDVRAPTGGFWDSTKTVRSEESHSATAINRLIREGNLVGALRTLASVPPGHEVTIVVPIESHNPLLPSGIYAYAVDSEEWAIPLKVAAQALQWVDDVSKHPKAALDLAEAATAEDGIDSFAARRALAFLLSAEGTARVTHATSPGELVVQSSENDSPRVRSVPLRLIQPHVSFRRAFDHKFNEQVERAEEAVDVCVEDRTEQSLGNGVKITYARLWNACQKDTKLGDLQKQLGVAAREYNAKMVYLFAINSAPDDREAESLRRRVMRLKQKIDRASKEHASHTQKENPGAHPPESLNDREGGTAQLSVLNRSTFRWVWTFGLSIAWGLVGSGIASAAGMNLASLGFGSPASLGSVLQIGLLIGLGTPLVISILRASGWYNLVAIGFLLAAGIIILDTALSDRTIQSEANLVWILGLPLILIYEGCMHVAEGRYPREDDVSGQL